MPRYFLHTHDDRGEALDLQGVECPDLEAARGAAVSSIRSWVGGEIQRGRVHPDGRVEVVEGYNRTAALVVPFEAAMQVLA